MTRIARPAHPGQFIRMEIIEPLGLFVTAAAKILGVTRPALSTLLNPRLPTTFALGLLARGSSMTEATVLGCAPPSEPSDGPTVTTGQDP